MPFSFNQHEYGDIGGTFTARVLALSSLALLLLRVVLMMPSFRPTRHALPHLTLHSNHDIIFLPIFRALLAQGGSYRAAVLQ